MFGYDYNSPRRVQQEQAFKSPNTTNTNSKLLNSPRMPPVSKLDSPSSSPNGPAVASRSLNGHLSTYTDLKGPSLAQFENGEHKQLFGYEYLSPRRIKHDKSFESPNSKPLRQRGSPFMNVFRPDSTNSSPNRTITGPLLTSMSFNSNLSTYMDSKSPGLAERIVQYQNESQKTYVTHQAKYGSPGVFPVVHLSKKDLPIRTIQPDHKVTVRLAPPDIYQPYRKDRKLSESISPNRFTDLSHISGGDLKTHNVLDALRRLSRKRLHCNEEYSQRLASKKKCFESMETEAVIEKPPSNLNTDRHVGCAISAMEASLTSSHPDMIERLNGSITASTSEADSPPPKKKLCTIETQTDTIPEPPKQINILSNIIVAEKTTKSAEPTETNKPEEEVMEHEISSDNLAEMDNEPYGFALENIKSDRLLSYFTALPSSTATDLPTTEPSAVTPVIAPEDKLIAKKVTFNLPAETEPHPEEKTTAVLLPIPKPETTASEIIAKLTAEPKESKVSPFGDFSAPKVTTVASNFFKHPEAPNSNQMSTSPKLGGFKFDFKSEKPATSPQMPSAFNSPSITTLAPTNSFSPSAALRSPQLGTNTNVTSSGSPNLILCTGAAGPVKKVDTFLPPQSLQAPTFGTVRSSESNVHKFSSATPAVPTFGSVPNPSGGEKLNFAPSASTANPFASKTEPNSNMFSAATPSLGVATTASANANNNLFSFGNQANTTQPGGFGKTGNQNIGFSGSRNAKNLFEFGESMQQPAVFGEPSKPPAFGEASKPPAFGEASKPPAFGEPSKPFAFGEPSKQSAFGEPSKPLAFGEPSKQSTFGEPPKESMFGPLTKQSAFGEPSKQPTFGEPPKESMFGPLTKQSAFGEPSKQPTFGEPPKESMFGPLTKQSAFGEPSKQPSFGESTKPSAFGAPFTFGADNSKKETNAKPIFEVAPTTKPQMGMFKFGSSSATEAQPFQAPSASLFAPQSNPLTFNPPSTLPNNPPPFNATTFNSPALPAMNLFNNAPAPNAAPGFNSAPRQPPAFNALPANGGPFNAASSNMFGSVPTTMFGTTAQNPNFNSGAQPQFGAAPSTGMFNIGSGSSTPRTRTTLKARRRT